MDPEYAAKLGVNVNELLISQPDSGEEALNILESFVRSGMISVVVVDSVAALTPRAELEGEMGEQHVGRQARMMGQALRKLTAIAANSRTLIIFINQLRMKIGIMFGNPETTPGGRALPFAASVRIDIRRIAQVKKGEKRRRQSRKSKGGKEQSCAAVPLGGIRHPVRRRNFLRRRRPERRGQSRRGQKIRRELQL